MDDIPELKTREDFILMYLGNKSLLIYLVMQRYIAPSNMMKTIILDLADPELTYWFCTIYGHKENLPRCRTICCKDSIFAYWYARDIDEKPRRDTEIAASKDAHWEKEYRRWAYKP